MIFMDHLMPVMDGVECLNHIKEMKDHPNITTPIIILTANAIIGAKEEYIKAGFTDYLPKPIQERELQQMLVRYLPKELVTLCTMDELVKKAGGKKKAEKKAADVAGGNVADGTVAESVATDGTASAGAAVAGSDVTSNERNTEMVETSKTENLQAEASNAAVEAAQAAAEDDFVVDPDAPLVDRLKATGMIDTSVGMSYCMDDEDFYGEMLSEYMKSEKKTSMVKFFEAKDWENYRITVHALKSTSLTIGAVELSEQAKALEMACKENNETYINDNHEQVLKCYEGLLVKLDKALNSVG
jgi:HPt (histidine-containing phosphotransfer) domain-containing protein